MTDTPGRVPTPKASVEVFLQIIETMTNLSVSCVVEDILSEESPDKEAD